MEFSPDGKNWEFAIDSGPLRPKLLNAIKRYGLVDGQPIWCRDSPTAKPFTMVVGRDVK